MNKCVVLLLGALLMLSGCAKLHPQRLSIVEDYFHGVVVEAVPSPSEVKTVASAAALELDVLKDLMGQLTYVSETTLSGGQDALFVFMPEEIERLAPSLHQALAQCGAGQWVHFVSFNQKKGVLFSQSRKSEGVCFISADQQVNFSFYYINANRASSETSARYHRYSVLDPLEILESRSSLVADRAGVQAMKSAGGDEVPMWISINVERFESALKPEEHYPVISPVAEVRDGTTPAVKTTSGPAAVPMTQQQDIKEQLKFLKSLFEEGLITQVEYQTKKSEILNKIR
jgi:hypothetical protein